MRSVAAIALVMALASLAPLTSAEAQVLDFKYTEGSFADTFSIDTSAGFRKVLTNPDFLYFRTIGDSNGFGTVFFGDKNRDGYIGVGYDTGPYVFPYYQIFIEPALYSGAGTTINFPITRFVEGDETLTISTSAVPEPSTWAMMLLGFFGLGFLGYCKRCSDDTGATRCAV